MKPSDLDQKTWVWHPNQRYGPMMAGCRVSDLPLGFVIGIGERSKHNPSFVYFETAVPGVEIIEIDDQISGVNCTNEFWLNGHNLIGLRLGDAAKHVPAKVIQLGQCPFSDEIEFDALGLTLRSDDEGETVQLTGTTLLSHYFHN